MHVDDVVFIGMSIKMVNHFFQQMQAEFKMSVVDELTCFLVFPVNQMEDGIFIS